MTTNTNPTATTTQATPEKGGGEKRLFNPHMLLALEETRDVLCAFHRDHPSQYEPDTSNALRFGLAVIERAKKFDADPSSALELLEEWIHGGECFCTEGVAFRGPCTFCKTKQFLTATQPTQRRP